MRGESQGLEPTLDDDSKRCIEEVLSQPVMITENVLRFYFEICDELKPLKYDAIVWLCWRLKGFREQLSLDFARFGLQGEHLSLFSAIPNLVGLSLRGGGFDADCAAALSQFPNLKMLNVSSNELVDDGVVGIGQITTLTELDLSNNRIGSEGFACLASLKRLAILRLSGNNVDYDGVTHLAKLERLTELDLSGNATTSNRKPFGDDGAAKLSALTQLRKLKVPNLQIGNRGVIEISKLRQLEHLELNWNKFGSAGAAALSGLQSLTYLNIELTGVDDACAIEIAKLKRLKTLYVGHNCIGRSGATQLADLKCLEILNISANPIGDEGAAALATLPFLRLLHICSCNLTDPRVLLQLVSLKTLEQITVFGNAIRAFKGEGRLPDSLLSGHSVEVLRRLLEDYRKGPAADIAFGRGVLLGPGENGKTQLSRHLAGHPDRHRPIDADDRTWGIVPWEVALDDLRIALLDCGGQDSQVSAHTNLILMGSTRSIYLICFRADRDPDYAPYYFGLLEEVRKRAMGIADPDALPRDRNDKVPVIVIVTFGDAPNQQLRLHPLRGLAKQYPWLHVLFVDSYHGLIGRDVNEVRSRMREHVRGMGQIRTAMSATMQRLRPRVRELFQADEPVPTSQTPPPAKCMMSLDEYLALYKSVCDPEEATAMLMADHHLRELDNLCDVIAPGLYRTIDPGERLPLEQAVQWVLNPRFVNVYLYQRILRDGGRLGKNGFLSNQDIRSVTNGLNSSQIDVLMTLMIDRLIAFPWSAQTPLGTLQKGYLVPDLLLPRVVPADWGDEAFVIGGLNCQRWLGETAYFQFLSERNQRDQLAPLPLSTSELQQSPEPTGVFRNECMIIDPLQHVQTLVQFEVLRRTAVVSVMPQPGHPATSRDVMVETLSDILAHLKRLTAQAEPRVWVEHRKLDNDGEVRVAILKIIDRVGSASGREIELLLDSSGHHAPQKRLRKILNAMASEQLISYDGPSRGPGAKWIRRRPGTTSDA